MGARRQAEAQARARARALRFVTRVCAVVAAVAGLWIVWRAVDSSVLLIRQNRATAEARRTRSVLEGTSPTWSMQTVDKIYESRRTSMFVTGVLKACIGGLPAGYVVTRLSFADGVLRLWGNGALEGAQDQLAAVNSYVEGLRADSAFAATFERTSLVSAERQNVAGRPFVVFEIAAWRKGGKGE